MDDIVLSFGTHTVIDHASFTLELGQIHAIIGENGAGKSVLMKILAGVYTPTQGRISVNAEIVHLFSVDEMRRRGIFLFEQSQQLIDFFTIEENLFLGCELGSRFNPVLQKKRQLQRARQVLQSLECSLDPALPVYRLTPHQKLTVCIAKALLQNARVLILDEVAMCFSQHATDSIFQLLQKLAARGMGIVIISHKLEQVIKFSSRLTIMRDGKSIDATAQLHGAQTTQYEGILEAMAGQSIPFSYPKTAARRGEILYKSCVPGLPRELYIRRGEIVGVAGLQGAGKVALLRSVAGVDGFSRSAQTRARAAFLSSNEFENLIGAHSVENNLTLPALARFCQGPLLNKKRCYYHTENMLEKFHIPGACPSSRVNCLSTGARQKLSIAKLLNTDCDLLVMDDPSHALDVIARVDLYNIMNNLVHQGYAIFFTSSDTSELLGMCDRIYVMFEGSVVAELKGRSMNSRELLFWATGCLHDHPYSSYEVSGV